MGLGCFLSLDVVSERPFTGLILLRTGTVATGIKDLFNRPSRRFGWSPLAQGRDIRTDTACVERIEPMRLFSFRWHPYALDPGHDYSAEPMTLVTFELAEVEGGVLLTITELGFDDILFARRAQAIEVNDGGWAHQAKLIEKYLALEQGR